MRGLIVNVFRAAGRDCSNNGVSAKAERLLLVGEGVPEVFESVDEPIVYLDMREGWDHPALTPRIVPFVEGEGKHSMFGGNFAYSSDSRFQALSPHGQPLPIHDRYE